MKRYILRKFVSAITAFAFLASAAVINAAEVEGDSVYTYQFEYSGDSWRTDTKWKVNCASSGAEWGALAGGIGTNTTTVAKFAKTSTTAGSAYSKVFFTTLGKDIDYQTGDGAAKYFKVDFKIYVDGDGFEYAAPCGYWQDVWATPLSIKDTTPYNTYGEDYQKPIACLEPDSWNDVTYVFYLTDKTQSGDYYYFNSYSDIYVNGVQVAQGSEYKNARSVGPGIETSLTDSDHVGIYFLMRSKYDDTASQTFTAYLDDIGLTTYDEN